MQVLKIFTPFLICCCIFCGINVECGKDGGIKAAGKQHQQGGVQAKSAAKKAIVKKEETLKAKSKGMKKTATGGGQVQKQMKNADKKANELVRKGKEAAVKKSKSTAESKATCMQKCMCEKWETHNNTNFNGQKEETPIRAKRANEHCKECDKKVGDKDADNDRWCAECKGWCADADVYSAESTDLYCYYCDGDDIIKRKGEYYCPNCHESRSEDKVYEWNERSESPESDDDSDSSNDNDPCNSANSNNYQQFNCDQCSTEDGCNHLSSLIVENYKCDWINDGGYQVCRKFVKYGLDGNELVDSD